MHSTGKHIDVTQSRWKDWAPGEACEVLCFSSICLTWFYWWIFYYFYVTHKIFFFSHAFCLRQKSLIPEDINTFSNFCWKVINFLFLKSIHSYQRNISFPKIHMLKHNPQSESILKIRSMGDDLGSMMEFLPLQKEEENIIYVCLTATWTKEGFVRTSSGRDLAGNPTRLKPWS